MSTSKDSLNLHLSEEQSLTEGVKSEPSSPLKTTSTITGRNNDENDRSHGDTCSENVKSHDFTVKEDIDCLKNDTIPEFPLPKKNRGNNSEGIGNQQPIETIIIDDSSDEEDIVGTQIKRICTGENELCCSLPPAKNPISSSIAISVSQEEIINVESETEEDECSETMIQDKMVDVDHKSNTEEEIKGVECESALHTEIPLSQGLDEKSISNIVEEAENISEN